MKTPRELTDLLRRYEPAIQDITIALRQAVLDEIGPCHETVYQVYRNSVISLLYSTTEKRMKDNICLIVVYKDHVNLMFPRGVDVKDPRCLLEGAGKAMRHVKMLTAADTGRPGVRQLITQAKKRSGLGTPERPLKKVVTELRDQRPQPPRKQTTLPRLF